MRARLPQSAPEAPWALSASALVWVAPPTRAAARARQPGVSGRPLAVGGMFVSYRLTPVGPYHEVIGFVVLGDGLRVAVHIPFIAVDSPASVLGGRANWSLPKTLAQFSGDLLHERVVRARHAEWQVSARARALPAPLPLRLRFVLAQAAADGSAQRSGGRARVRLSPALVRVRTSGPPELTDWLGCGVYPGALVTRFEGELAAPGRSARPHQY
jgi:hypothetical protein